MARSPVLFIAATPIGNLSDVSDRLRETLAGADLILAEDTRNTRKLLSALKITGKELIPYHDHIEQEKSGPLVQKILREGSHAVLVSDAGTPLVADPGYRLVEAAHAHGLKVVPIPGPSAVMALASSCGLSTGRIFFVGFIPEKKGDRSKEFASWKHVRSLVIYFEALRRAGDSFKELAEAFPGAHIAIGRELTKMHEQIERMPVEAAAEWLKNLPVKKGELTVAIDLMAWGNKNTDSISEELELSADEQRAKIIQRAREGFRSGATLKDLLKELKDCGMSRSELYQLLLELKP